jgi:hypothetical protein
MPQRALRVQERSEFDPLSEISPRQNSPGTVFFKSSSGKNLAISNYKLSKQNPAGVYSSPRNSN